jgi:hypothetical protein
MGAEQGDRLAIIGNGLSVVSGAWAIDPRLPSVAASPPVAQPAVEGRRQPASWFVDEVVRPRG